MRLFQGKSGLNFFLKMWAPEKESLYGKMMAALAGMCPASAH
jgi:hypothetical protein